MDCPNPLEITLHQASRSLEILFEDHRRFHLPFEYLRVYSPSAEVQGHGIGEARLELGKSEVTITALRPVGHYGLCPSFSDGHATGIYTFAYLYELGLTHPQRWQAYLERVKAHEAQQKTSSNCPPPGDPA